MKGKIHIFVFVLCVFLSAQAYGQTSSPIDLVLLLDTSAGMSSSYDNVNNYISGPFLNEYLRVGDTFHLISFASNPRLDAARRISGVGDVETIIGRMFLQYPVERGANAGAAISYAEQYIISLPNRPKKIVLISTGSQETNNLVTSAKSRLSSRNATLDYVQVTPGQPLTNLPKSGRPAIAATRSGSAVGTSGEAGRGTSGGTTTTTQDTRSTSTTDSRTGTGITSTGTGTSSAGTGTSSTSTSTTTSSGTGSGTSTVSDTSTSSTGASTSTDSRQSSTSTTSQATGTTGDSSSSTASGSSSTGTSATSGGTSGEAGRGTDTKVEDRGSTQAAGRETTSATYPETQKTREGSSINWSENLPLIIGIILGILLLLALILFLSSRRLGSSPNRAMARAASPSSSSPSSYGSEERFADHSKDLNSFAASSSRRSTPYENKNYSAPVINPTGPLLLNLYVEDQNTAIGKRNIHSLKSGFGFSVGGGKSDDFLIFLVPMPAGIGEIRRDGSTLTFTPKKAKYFPDIGSTPVRDCINKTIRIVSDKNYEMRFRFEMYEDPLIALNRVLMQVKVPGMV